MGRKRGIMEERKGRADQLLERIETYLLINDLSASYIGAKAGLHCRYVQDLRDGVTPRHNSMDVMEAFLDANPDGVDYKPRNAAPDNAVSYTSLLEMSRAKESPAAFVVNRDPCFKCGVRRDIGCEHHAASAPIPLRDAV